jgi:NAD(P)-dependent dehydrogenase (short-subunit alcohol dehydrogenase family)
MILITGATGNIGSALIQKFVAAGIPVRALVRSPEKAQQIVATNVEIAIGDFTQPDSVSAALQEVEKLQQLGRVLGHDLQLVQLSPEDYRQGMTSAGMPEWLINCLMEMSGQTQTPMVKDSVSVITGRSPILFKQFAEDYVEAFR